MPCVAGATRPRLRNATARATQGGGTRQTTFDEQCGSLFDSDSSSCAGMCLGACVCCVCCVRVRPPSPSHGLVCHLSHIRTRSAVPQFLQKEPGKVEKIHGVECAMLIF